MVAGMASHLELLIFDGDGLPAALPSGAKIVSLSDQLRLVPVADDLWSPATAWCLAATALSTSVCG
jgi:hypothetical protein